MMSLDHRYHHRHALHVLIRVSVNSCVGLVGHKGYSVSPNAMRDIKQKLVSNKVAH